MGGAGRGGLRSTLNSTWSITTHGQVIRLKSICFLDVVSRECGAAKFASAVHPDSPALHYGGNYAFGVLSPDVMRII